MSLRWGLGFVLVGLLVAGLLYDRVVPLPSGQAETAVETMVVSPSVADPPRLDGAWYCPVGSSSIGGYADHVVNIANLAEEPAVANLTLITDDGAGSRRRIDLEPLSTHRVELADIQAADVAGAVVEITGGRGAVGHTVTTATGVAEGPCATQASSTWHFAAGRTKIDAQQYLVLMNPFPETAVFDVEFQALGRSREPGPLQGAFVGARSIRIIDVNQFVTREESLAAKITTDRGRLVVERLQMLNGERGPTGAAVQLGVPTPAPSWMFTAGRIQADGDDLLTIYNPYEPDPDALDVADDSAALVGADDSAALVGAADASTVQLGSMVEGGATEDTVSDPASDPGGEPGPAPDGDPAPDALVLEEEGTTTVAIELWPTNPTDLSTYSVVTIEREVRPGTFVTIDLRAQAERFEFPLPYELGVFVTTDDEQPIVVERWQFADRLIRDSLAAITGQLEEGDEPGVEDLLPELQEPEAVLGDLPQPIATQGVSTTRGNDVFSTRWTIPWVTMVGDSTVIAVASADEASVEVRTLVDGRWEGPFRATVTAGGRALIPVTSVAGGAAVEVMADEPVSVEAMVVVPDQSLDVVPAVPTVNR